MRFNALSYRNLTKPYNAILLFSYTAHHTKDWRHEPDYRTLLKQDHTRKDRRGELDWSMLGSRTLEKGKLPPP